MQHLIVAFLLLASSIAGAAEMRGVMTSSQLLAAIGRAKAGDTIVLADGNYDIGTVECTAAGSSSAPITVRAQHARLAVIRVNGLEGFRVSGPGWRFEGLDVVGVCAKDSDCEHAFVVSGAAHGFALTASRVHDFNLPVRSKLAGGVAPNDGLIDGNEIFDSRARDTAGTVGAISIGAGSRWVVRDNYLHDFAHLSGSVTYAAVMKGGGKGGVFERNVVVCARSVLQGGERVGISFGSGGSGPDACLSPDPQGECLIEHDGGVVRNNVIASCSDVAIYLNQARDTHILYNTMVGTLGVDFRYANSGGEARGNAYSGTIRGRDGGSFGGLENRSLTAADFAAMYVSPLTGDLRKKGDLTAVIGGGSPVALVADDHCKQARGSGKWDVGAVAPSVGACDTRFVAPKIADVPELPALVVEYPTTVEPSDGGATRSDGAADGGGNAVDGGIVPTVVDGRDDGEPDVTVKSGGCSSGGPFAGEPLGLLLVCALYRRRSECASARPPG